MKLHDFVRTRPYLYHLTSSSNVDGILRAGVLRPAAEFYEMAGREHEAHAKRAEHARLACRGHDVVLRDQAPLYAGKCRLHTDWQFSDLVRYLNRHVFFWPGTADGPIAAGKRHFDRYASEPTTVFRLSTRLLFELNPSPLFTRFNSGSPRPTNGVKPYRGPDTFLAADAFGLPPSRVTECVFSNPVVLPHDAVQNINPS